MVQILKLTHNFTDYICFFSLLHTRRYLTYLTNILLSRLLSFLIQNLVNCPFSMAYTPNPERTLTNKKSDYLLNGEIKTVSNLATLVLRLLQNVSLDCFFICQIYGIMVHLLKELTLEFRRSWCSRGCRNNELFYQLFLDEMHKMK